jgi:hypothetical protein
MTKNNTRIGLEEEMLSLKGMDDIKENMARLSKEPKSPNGLITNQWLIQDVSLQQVIGVKQGEGKICKFGCENQSARRVCWRKNHLHRMLVEVSFH